MKKNNLPIKILLVGGGTGGPVLPLVALAEEIKSTHSLVKFLLVGTRAGLEKKIAAQAKLDFKAIFAGKWRRYFSLLNIITPFQVLAGFFQALKIISETQPSAVVGAGGFVQVPVIYAAWVYRVPVIIHQQDIRPSLANRLCAPIARAITVSMEESLKMFSEGSGLLTSRHTSKVSWTGNPFRKKLLSANKASALEYFNFTSEWPTILVLGGGTGATFINDLIRQNLKEITSLAQVIHSTGSGKANLASAKNYRPFDFISRMDLAYATADIVVSRAGLSTITELSNLKKLAIIIPMPDTHQEENGEYLYRKRAAVVVDQKSMKIKNFPLLIRKLLFANKLKEELVTNVSAIMPHDAASRIAKIIFKLT